MTIKMFEKSQFEEVFQIMSSTLSECWTKEMLKESIEGKNNLCFVATKNNEVVAFANLLKCFDEIELLDICVKKTCQGKKIGKTLLCFVVNYLKENGFSKIFLEVSQNNFVAKNLYSGFGFKKTYLRKNYYKNGDDAEVLVKIL
ncbi:MAG: ribosomal protein S18-alanine N-acetyltransferase [Clostridia bacterium]